MQSLPILLVEPDVLSRASTRAVLEGKGYAVVEAPDADQALKIANGQPLALVVTELYLPSASDRCLVHAMRQSPSLRRLTVLAYTGHGRAGDRAWAISEGADGYVLKKNGGPRLLEVVSRLESPSRRRRTQTRRRRRSPPEA